MNKKIKPSVVAPSPMWTLDDGISYSMLSRFINCRERFRLYAIEGMRQQEKASKHGMNWGTYFHSLIETEAKHRRWGAETCIRKTETPKVSFLPRQEVQVAKLVYRRYRWFWNEVEEERPNYIDAEVVFQEKYRLPNGRTVLLVGKTDELIGNPDGSLKVQESKTKEKIYYEKIEATVPWDIQCLMYATAMQLRFKKPVTGFLYNVIRNPSSKPKKGESFDEYLERLDADIVQRPNHYFMRWDFLLTKAHHERWRREVFDPLLTQLVMWWESVKHDPFSPWTTPEPAASSTRKKGKKLVPNPHHYQRPFGIYDSMTTGTGDFYNVITRNVRSDVSVGNEPFQELPGVYQR